MRLKDIEFTEKAIREQREEALWWMQNNGFGRPKSWGQEQSDCDEFGNTYADGQIAPVIAGYEALVAEGLAVRGDYWPDERGDMRIYFSLTESGRGATIPPDFNFDVSGILGASNATD